MRAIAWIIAVLALLPVAHASVVISQVLYDPINTESGGEAVELRNDGTSAVNISKWVLATESTPNDAIIPENTFLGPGDVFLIADKGWNSSKDNPEWKNPDLEETITLANSDSGTAIKDASGAVIDAVGWGVAANIKAGLFEGTPAAQVKEGNALVRAKHAGNNADDFIEGEPVFFSGEIVTIIVNVSNESVTNLTTPLPLGAALNDDDSAEPGVQLKPVAGGTRTLHLEAYYNGTWVKAGWFGKSVELVKNGSKWSGELQMEYWYAPGMQQVALTADRGSASIPVTILELKAAKLETKTVSLKASPGRTAEGVISVRNEGNVAVDVSWAGDDLVFGNSSISSENLVIVSRTIQPKETGSIDIILNVPENTPQGEYRSIVRMNEG
jgi:hypothetical protein